MEQTFTTRADLVRWMVRHALGSLLLGMVCILVVVSIEVALPLFFGQYLVDQVLIERQLEMVTVIAVAGIGLFLFKGIFTYGQVYLLTFVGQRLVYQLRRMLYARVLKLSVQQQASHPRGTLVARMTSDIGVIQNAVIAGFGDLVQHGLTLVAVTVMLFVLNWRLALVSAVALPLAAWTIRAYGLRVRQNTTRLQERIASLTSTFQQSLDGFRLVKAFRMERELERRFEEDNSSGFQSSMKSVQAMATVNPVVEVVLVTGMFLVIWWGARDVLAGQMTAGGLISFVAYLAMATRPIGFLTKSMNLLYQALSAVDRIVEILRIPEDKSERHEGLVRIERPQGHIEFEQVSFQYDDDQEALHEVSFEIKPGETVGIVGPSGAGKSTLVNLLLRFYDPTSGAIRLDGEDMSRIDASSLRRWIGLVPQETLLFNMSIKENIAAGRDWITDADVVEAARLANAHEFIERLPDGYDTVLGIDGQDLSGGQRQRIAIARAVAGDPSILLLDEATSALDGHSESQVRDALSRVRKSRTTIIIAHRLSTLRHAEKILVLEDGRLAQVGSHEELGSGSDTYRKLFGSELSVGGATSEVGLE